MLGGYTSKVQSELDAFFANLANRADLLREVSAQAFAKARMQVSAQPLNSSTIISWPWSMRSSAFPSGTACASSPVMPQSCA
jgi:hypothetical protein